MFHLPHHVGLVAPGFGWQTNATFPVLPSQHKLITDWMGDNQSDGSSLTSLPATDFNDSAVGVDETAVTPDPTEVADCSKLKGVLWPGMDLFDSATLDQKKKRNQRKDGSVVKRLERDSTVVEATEFVWSPLGNLKKSLAITGEPEEDDEYMLSSPVKPSPRKYTRKRETRTVLSELDGEHSRNPRRTQSNQGHLASQDDTLETQLTYAGGQKRKRFLIHEDEDEHPQQPRHGSNISHQPTALNLLTQTFPGPNHLGHNSMAYESSLRYGSQAYLNKENAVPPNRRLAQLPQGYCATSMGFSMAQYSLSQPVSAFHYNNSNTTFSTWGNQEASSMFAHPSQSFADHDPLKLSPIKEDRNVADDDERTITAPPSEV